MSNPPNNKEGFRKAVFPKATIEETNQQWQRWEMRDFSAPRKPKIPAFKMEPLPPAAESTPAFPPGARSRPRRYCSGRA